MSSNISYLEQYYDDDMNEEEYYDEDIQIELLFEDNNRQNINNRHPNHFLDLLELFLLMQPILNVLDPLEIAIQNSENDLCLHKDENITLNLNCQPYDTTNKQYDSCSICTDNYDKKEDVAVLNCGHIYHPNCINEWGKYKPNCPICKADITFYHYISDLEEPD
jgi:hypothetical protein